MGQSGSAHIETLSHNTQQAAPLPVKKVPPPRPSSPPPCPAPIKRTPSYVVPKNLVMPGGILPKTKLRPVSQEISKFYPEFANIFPPKDNEEWSISLDVSMETASSGDSEKKNSSRLKENISENENLNVNDEIVEASTLPRTSNSNHKSGNEQIVGDSNSQLVHHSVHATAGVKRTNSLDRSPISAANKGHRRNTSVTARSLMNEQNTIFEDPREHLYDHWRKDPYTNALPTVVSLPVKSKFDIDVSYNMTYAQLAEYRRKTNLEELEKNTGINLNQLSEDLNSNKQPTTNPFDRHYLRASSRSTSTASSDTGVSKRKKKRAPPPPTSNSNPPDNEPPADYDEDDMSPRSFPNRLYLRKSSVSSMGSTTSSKTKMAPPPPDASKLSSVNVFPSNPMQDNVSAMITKDKSVAEEMKSLSDKTKDSPEQNAIDKLDALLNLPDSSDSTITELDSDTVEGLIPNSNRSTKETVDEVSSVTDIRHMSKCAEDRLNCLVQNHDITFDNEDSESEKTVSLLPSEKTKSPQDMFKEQLAKAYDERQQRNKLLFDKKKEKQDTTKLSEQKQEEAVNLLKKMSRDLDKKWLADHRHTAEMEDHLSDRELDEETSESTSQRVFSDDWTPQHDLDSDDDIDDSAMVNSPRTKSEGFKATIIPPKVHDLKTEEKQKKGKYTRRTSDSPTDDKHKYGSIRNFKKNVRKSVQNAFGSISRASEKLLLKAKSQDLLNETKDVQPNALSNWQLSPEKSADSAKNGKIGKSPAVSNRASKYQVEEFSEEDDSECSDEDLDVNRTPEPAGQMKQTGLAYVSGHKQVVLLPDFKTVKLDKEGNIVDSLHEENNWAPKIFRKKKKFTYESTVRKKEKEKIDKIVSEKIHQKERQIEFERRRQLEMEKEFHRLRALENQEQLHRLQSAHMQQQLQALHQQQQQQHAFGGMSITAANGGIQGPNLMGTTGLNHAGFGQHQTMSHVMGQNMTSGLYPHGVGIPFINTPNMNGNHPSMNANLPSMNANLPNMGSCDINYLSNVMKMNGIQPPSTSHQWAYLLSSVNIPSPPFDVLHSKSMPVSGAGPDLSKVFTLFEDAESAYTQKRQFMDYLSTGRDSHGLNYNQSVESADTSKFTKLLDDFHAGAKSEQLEELQNELPHSDKPKLKSNPVYYSSDEDDSSNGLSPARTSMVAHIKVDDHREIPSMTNHSEMNGNAQTEALIFNSHVGNSLGASSKVYGPIGFKPVSFNSNSILSSPGDDDSSSGADR